MVRLLNVAAPEINLADLVEAVRDELEALDSKRQAVEKPALLQLAGLELELHFVVGEDRRREGGVDLKVVTVGAAKEMRSEQVQRVVVRFDVDPDARQRGVIGSRAYRSRERPGDDVAPLE